MNIKITPREWGSRPPRDIYCIYCLTTYDPEQGLSPECTGECGENPLDIDDNEDFKELQF